MKPFDVYFRRAQDPEWSAGYIDYASLKQTLTMFGKRRRKLKRGQLEWSTVLEEEDEQRRRQRQKLGENENENENENTIVFGYTLGLNNDIDCGNNNDNNNHLHKGCGGHGCGGVFGVVGGETKEERLSRIEHDAFKTKLQIELDRASRWFQTCWMDLQSSSSSSSSSFLFHRSGSGFGSNGNGNGNGNDDDDDDDQKKNTEENGLLKLYGFAAVNICVLRQLLLRYNAHVRMFEGSVFLSEWEVLLLQSTSSGGNGEGPTSSSSSAALALSASETEFQSEEFSVVTVVPSLLASLETLQDRMMTLPSYWMDDSAVVRTIQNRNTNTNTNTNNTNKTKTTSTNFRSRADELEAILDKTSWKQKTRQSLNKTERVLQTIRYCYTMGTAQMGISMEPKFLFTQLRGFKKEMKAMAVWRERPLGGGNDNNNNKGGMVVVGAGGMDPANVWPLVLNLVSCFLFMMNNYIIEPSSAYYANALGSSDALSGIMMGMAPWFALTSAVGYSVWTNTSYKQPILFSGVLMVVGNTLYGAAYSQQSMAMCLVGRSISGFGAPRIINRRYVADATPFKLRTMSSAAFALTTALGAASGPGFAILLDVIPEFEFPLPILGVQTFNGMTGPGFLMAFLWCLFTIAIVLTFTEPNRSGLDELKQREAKAAKEAKAGKEASKEAPLNPSGSFADESSLGRDEKSAVTDDYYDDYDDDYDDYYDDDYYFDDDSSVGSASVASGLLASEKRSGGKGNNDNDNDNDNDNNIDNEGVSKHSPLYCIKNMTRATALCMGLIFMKRIALESIVGSTSVITKNRYHWSIRNVGILHLVNGIIVIPVSIFAGWLSQYREDRYLAMWFMGVTSLGLLIMVDFSDLADTDENSDTYNEGVPLSVGPVQYVSGSLIAFSGVEACESFVASLMSKCVPSALAVGTFNSGLLATLVGTGGRAVGDLFITAMGLISIRNLLNLLIIPGLVLMLLSMFLLWRNYKIVAV